MYFLKGFVSMFYCILWLSMLFAPVVCGVSLCRELFCQTASFLGFHRYSSIMDERVEVNWVEGNRKNKLLEVAGFLFEKNRNIALGASYRCLQYNVSACPTRVHVTADGAYLRGTHSHAPKTEDIKARNVITEAKQMVKSNVMVTSKQVADQIENSAANQGLQSVHLGLTENLMRRMRYTKYKAFGGSNWGNTRAEINIPLQFTRTIDDREFLLYDNHEDENRMIVFATADALDKLAYCDAWLIDGTFKSCPPQFTQLYTIHGLYRNTFSVPFVFAYLPSKSYATYLELFEHIRRRVPGEPKIIISDFELAAINACKETFIATELHGCLFHLTQNIFKHVQQNPNVYERYKLADAEGRRVRTAIRSLGALAFARKTEVDFAFYELRRQFPMGDEVRNIFSYFQNTYLGNEWEDIRFPIKFWSVRSRFENAQPRTNNAKEGWHFRFNNLHSKPSPSMYTSVVTIRNEEKHFSHEIGKVNGGILGKKRKQSVAIDRRLRTIIENQENQVYHSATEFLEAIQTCLHDFLDE